MRKICFLLFTGLIFLSENVSAQENLPGFSANIFNKKICLSWLNAYPQKVKSISIQRSYDSSKNFSSIATVNNPANAANYFVDQRPPYIKMFYRLFIIFDSGAYVFSESKRADPDPDFSFSALVKKIGEENSVKAAAARKIDNIINSLSPAEKKEMLKVLQGSKAGNQPETKEKEEEPVIPYKPKLSLSNDNNIIINIPDFEPNKYDVKFYDKNDKLLFELNKLKEGYLIIEKVNFFHSGWFRYEIYEDGNIIEKNRFFIPKD